MFPYSQFYFPYLNLSFPLISLASFYLSFKIDWKANLTSRGLFKGCYQGQWTCILCAEHFAFIMLFNLYNSLTK